MKPAMLMLPLLISTAMLVDASPAQRNSLCSQYRHAGLNDTDAKFYQAWVSGYINGHNQQVAPDQRVAQPDAATVAAYVARYCAANPAQEVSAAVVCMSTSAVRPGQKSCGGQGL